MKLLHETAERALDALRGAGADRAICTAQRAVTQEFNVESGAFTLLRTLYDDSLVLTGFSGGRKGRIAVNRFDGESIRQAARDCMAAAASAEDDPAWEIAETGGGSFTDGAPEADLERFFGRCQELLSDIGERHPSVLIEQMILLHRATETVCRSTAGVVWERTAGAYEVDLSYSARDGAFGSSFFGSGLITASLDKPLIEQGTIERDLCEIERQVHPEPFTGKEVMPVVLTPDCFASLLASLLSHFAGDDAILAGTSPWRNRLGESVADPRLTVTISTDDPQIVLGERWTAEGFRSETYDVIRDGELRSFQLSQYVANRTGLTRAKNTDDTAFVVAPGGLALSELLEKVGRGLYVARFSGGEPASNGDFSGVAKNSFLIEDGKLGRAVSEVMISGNLADMLRSIVGLSAERACDGARVLPWAAFGGITVSGK